MSDDTALRGQVREAIEAGRIPARRPDRLWGGRVSGSRCAVCGAPMQAGEVVLEVQFDGDGAAGAVTRDVHIRCFVALEDHLNSRDAFLAASDKQPSAAAANIPNRSSPSGRD